VQRLAQDATEVAELREEVTRARVAVIMAKANTARVAKMAQEKVILPATAGWEADVAAHRIFILEVELVVVLRAWDVAEEKLPSLATKAVATDQ
jgi:hypothetical protein